MTAPPKLAMTADAITARIRLAARASDLRVGRRLLTKVDMSSAGIARRIAAASQMLTLCRRLAAWRPQASRR